jgi:hypothetical protein
MSHGLSVLSLQALKTNDTATQAAAVRLTNAACDTDTALEQLTDQALGAILDLACSADAAVALAALELAYSASISSAVRSRLCAQLVKPVQQQQQQQQQPKVDSGAQVVSSRPAAVWNVACGAGPSEADGRRVSARAVAQLVVMLSASPAFTMLNSRQWILGLTMWPCAAACKTFHELLQGTGFIPCLQLCCNGTVRDACHPLQGLCTCPLYTA